MSIKASTKNACRCNELGRRNVVSAACPLLLESSADPMLLFILAYLGGALTIVSPCILPVLPFVFARADQPFVKSGLPLLVGMAVTFAGVATLAVVSGEWAVQANQYGRIAAIALLAVFGITLLFPEIADRLTRPLVAAGAWLSQRAH